MPEPRGTARSSLARALLKLSQLFLKGRACSRLPTSCPAGPWKTASSNPRAMVSLVPPEKVRGLPKASCTHSRCWFHHLLLPCLDAAEAGMRSKQTGQGRACSRLPSGCPAGPQASSSPRAMVLLVLPEKVSMLPKASCTHVTCGPQHRLPSPHLSGDDRGLLEAACLLPFLAADTSSGCHRSGV